MFSIGVDKIAVLPQLERMVAVSTERNNGLMIFIAINVLIEYIVTGINVFESHTFFGVLHGDNLVMRIVF